MCIIFLVFTAMSSIQYNEHVSLLAPSVFSNYQGVELGEFEQMDNVTSETFAHTSKPKIMQFYTTENIEHNLYLRLCNSYKHNA